MSKCTQYSDSGYCSREGTPEKFRRKVDGVILISDQCDEHRGECNDQWEHVDELVELRADVSRFTSENSAARTRALRARSR